MLQSRCFAKALPIDGEGQGFLGKVVGQPTRWACHPNSLVEPVSFSIALLPHSTGLRPFQPNGVLSNGAVWLAASVAALSNQQSTWTSGSLTRQPVF
jgi:hypothetical protein